MHSADYAAEDRGAEGTEGVRFVEGVSPFPMGDGAVPPPQKIFLIFCLGMLHFGCNLMRFQT